MGEKKDGSQDQHLLSVQHEEPLRRRLLQKQLGRWIPSRSQIPFKGFHTMFNEEGTKVDEDETKMAMPMSRGASRGVTPFPRRLRRTRWSPNSPPRVSSSSPHPRLHLLSPMKHQKKINLMKSQKKSKFYVLCFYVSNISKLKYNFQK